MADRAEAIREQFARHKRDREQKDRAVPSAVEPDTDSYDLMAIKKKLATARALREQPSLASRAERTVSFRVPAGADPPDSFSSPRLANTPVVHLSETRGSHLTPASAPADHGRYDMTPVPLREGHDRIPAPPAPASTGKQW